jgi:membrane protein required for colicin V production
VGEVISVARGNSHALVLDSCVGGCSALRQQGSHVDKREEVQSALNWVDIVILASLAWFTFAAFHAGLIREVITIISAVFAVALAGLFYLELAEDIKVAVDDEQTAEIIAFAVIFGATVLAGQLIAFFLKQAASVLMLGIMDSMGGALIGLVKGFVFVEIALIAAVTFPSLGVLDSVENSTFAPFFLDALPVLRVILPGEFKSAIDSF